MILDCTLRDGGYYTSWDFDKKLVDNYLYAINKLPIDIIEVGYRSKPKNDYLGEYFYCPDHVLKHVKKNCNKKIAIMFNEKDVCPEDGDELLEGCDMVDMVRIAVNPANYTRALKLAQSIKQKGYEVAFNVMYMSKWNQYPEFMNQIQLANDCCDYFNIVDSFGGVYPDEVAKITRNVSSKLSIPIGFHGHNNLELGLINSLTAIDNGAKIIDATITGMGRGAGNLKTELLLTALNGRGKLQVNFNVLGEIVGRFEKLKDTYGWDTNLPYMIAGANSFPQGDVMEWASNRFYSYNSIIRALQNKKDGKEDNEKFSKLTYNEKVTEVLVIGGGPSANKHSHSIIEYLNQNKSMVVIHASSKNAKPFRQINNKQIFCLVGNEGRRMEDVFTDLKGFSATCVLPPFPRKMGTYVPQIMRSSCVELKKIAFTNTLLDTHTSIALQTAIDLGASTVLLAGYDGYKKDVSELEAALSKENNHLFNQIKSHLNIVSLFPNDYGIKVESIYLKYE